MVVVATLRQWWVDFGLGFMVVASGWVSGFWFMVVGVEVVGDGGSCGGYGCGRGCGCGDSGCG